VAQSYTEAAKWYRKAAEQGHAEAQVQLGVLYSNGLGVAANTAEATKWLLKAAEQGHAKEMMAEEKCCGAWPLSISSFYHFWNAFEVFVHVDFFLHPFPPRGLFSDHYIASGRPVS
jgi:hypothetical protein